MQMTKADRLLIKEQYMQKIRDEKERQELMECSFKPQINPYSIKLAEASYGREPFEIKAAKLQ